MRKIIGYILFIAFSVGYGQDTTTVTDTVDLKYREDQFYLGVTFNLLLDKPAGMEQSGFSGGLHAGYIRDMPINEKRNIAIGLGAGFSMNTYNQNLFVGEVGNEESVFATLDGVQYDKNWFSTYSIEAPLEFRWRTSTAASYKFWRIYTGLKFGYIYAYKFNFEQPGNRVVQTEVAEFERLRYGATFTFGYDTFNFHFYYSLNPFFGDEARINGESIGLHTFKLGLMFYIL